MNDVFLMNGEMIFFLDGGYDVYCFNNIMSEYELIYALKFYNNNTSSSILSVIEWTLLSLEGGVSCCTS
jgi:hypothetical protein